MELIGNLKTKVEEAKSAEEARRIIEEAGIRLTDSEFELIAGGGKVEDFTCNPLFVSPDEMEGRKFKHPTFY